MSRKGGDHPGDRFLQKRDRATPTRGEMSPANQQQYDRNMEAAKEAYTGHKKADRKGQGNRGGRTAGREPSPDQDYTAADRKRLDDEASARHVAAVEAREQAAAEKAEAERQRQAVEAERARVAAANKAHQERLDAQNRNR